MTDTGLRILFCCPVCGSLKANYARINGRWNISCWRCGASGLGGGEYLRELVGYVGAPHGAALLDDPAEWLGHLALGLAHPAGGVPPPLPPRGWFRRCATRLRSSRAGAQAREYLATERGIARGVLRAAGVGWDADPGRLVFPFFRDDEIVAYKTRPLDGQMDNCPGKGRPWPLYPRVPPGEWALLVAGELDALRGLSAGLPAVSVPLGAGLWRDQWSDDLRGLEVCVCFDNGENEPALRVVSALNNDGVRAARWQLDTLGLPTTPKGDLSDFLNAGGDPRWLHRRARAA